MAIRITVVASTTHAIEKVMIGFPTSPYQHSWDHTAGSVRVGPEPELPAGRELDASQRETPAAALALEPVAPSANAIPPQSLPAVPCSVNLHQIQHAGCPRSRLWKDYP